MTVLIGFLLGFLLTAVYPHAQEGRSGGDMAGKPKKGKAGVWKFVLGGGLIGASAYVLYKLFTTKPGNPLSIFRCPECTTILDKKYEQCPHCETELLWPNPGGKGKPVTQQRVASRNFWVVFLVLAITVLIRIFLPIFCADVFVKDVAAGRLLEWLAGAAAGAILGQPLGIASVKDIQPTPRP